MATATEMHELSDEFEKGGLGDSTATRVFLVDVPARDADALTATGLPATGTVHPDFAALYLDRYRFRGGPAGKCYVHCLYSNDGRFTQRPRIDRLDEEFFSWSFDIERVEVVIPKLERLSATFPDPAGGSPTNKLIWKRSEDRLFEDRPVWILSTSASDLGGSGPGDPGIALGSTDFDAIRAQNRKVHEIDGVKYAFSFGQARQQRGDRWQIEYRWTLDVGTKIELSGFPTTGYSATYRHIGDNATASEQTLRLPCWATPVAGDTETSLAILRDPYTKVDIRPPAIASGVIDPAGDRTFFKLREYVEDELDGWESLPGITVAP